MGTRALVAAALTPTHPKWVNLPKWVGPSPGRGLQGDCTWPSQPHAWPCPERSSSPAEPLRWLQTCTKGEAGVQPSNCSPQPPPLRPSSSGLSALLAQRPPAISMGAGVGEGVLGAEAAAGSWASNTYTSNQFTQRIASQQRKPGSGHGCPPSLWPQLPVPPRCTHGQQAAWGLCSCVEGRHSHLPATGHPTHDHSNLGEHPAPGPSPHGRQYHTWTAWPAHVPHTPSRSQLEVRTSREQGQAQLADRTGPSTLDVVGVFCPHTRTAWGPVHARPREQGLLWGCDRGPENGLWAHTQELRPTAWANATRPLPALTG